MQDELVSSFFYTFFRSKQEKEVAKNEVHCIG